MSRGRAISLDLETGRQTVADAPDLLPDELAAEATRAATVDRESKREAKLRALKGKFKAGTATNADRDRALQILCGIVLRDSVEDGEA